jgi:flagellar FliL protein
MVHYRFVAAAALLCLPGVTGAPAWAEEAPPPAASEVRYIELQPSLVTNFGGPSDAHLMYLRADVTVSVASSEAVSATKYHLPALRHALVLLLSRQSETDVATNAGREVIRAEALEQLRGILEAEEGEPYIDDLLFTNFIVQR